jgi:hypothetical protein
MNSYETLSDKELKSVEENLMKQLEKVQSERKSRSKNSNEKSTSAFKISLFSDKKEDKKEKVEKVDKKEKVKKESSKSSKEEDDDKKPRAIKATIASMKEVLDYHHVDYPSNAKKDDLAKLLRENNLVREAEKKESNKKAD